MESSRILTGGLKSTICLLWTTCVVLRLESLSNTEPSVQPIGVGFSYGKRVNNSRDAADDVYDFLQKFFILFPQLSKFAISILWNETFTHLLIEIVLLSQVVLMAAYMCLILQQLFKSRTKQYQKGKATQVQFTSTWTLWS